MATTTYGFSAEEALIVILVLALWVAAIALFFNRWGKIRMLEPYQPKFVQQNRPSCSLVDQALLQHQPRSFSKFNVHGEALAGHSKTFRPRQNSAFVAFPAVTSSYNAPRKVKSAFDLKNLMESHPSSRENAPAVKNCFDGYYFRRQSMLTIFSKDFPTDNSKRDSVLTNKEHRSSFKDLTDVGKNQIREKVHLHREDKDALKNEFRPRQLKSGETKLRSNGLSQNVFYENRRNSIAYLDIKSLTGNPNRFLLPERRFSLFQSQKTALPIARVDTDETRRRAEMKTPAADFRRNSLLLPSCVDVERKFLNSKETVKSGVIDFRRNSMLILNNLTEDIDGRFLSRNSSLSSSKVALSLDPYVIIRKDSTNPLFCHDFKRKTSVSKMNPPLNSKLNISHSNESKCEPENQFSSFDFVNVFEKLEHKNTNRLSFTGESEHSFFKPSHNGSIASLNNAGCSLTVSKVMEESRSAEHVDSVNNSNERKSYRDRGKVLPEGGLKIKEEPKCRCGDCLWLTSRQVQLI